MVKGVSRQVIVVKSPDPRLFEQAIFIVRESVPAAGVTPDQILEEARRVADGYIRRNTRPRRVLRRIPAPVFMAAGASFTGVLWLLVTLL